MRANNKWCVPAIIALSVNMALASNSAFAQSSETQLMNRLEQLAANKNVQAAPSPAATTPTENDFDIFGSKLGTRPDARHIRRIVVGNNPGRIRRRSSCLET